MAARARNSGKIQRKRGDSAESVAESLLVSKGAFVLARNFSCPRGELDLVVAFGDTVVIVEVKKRRSGTDDALSAITETKRKKLVHATREYLRRSGFSERPVRFDVVALGRSGEAPVHVEDAFDASGIDD